eukprot:299643_1
MDIDDDEDDSCMSDEEEGVQKATAQEKEYFKELLANYIQNEQTKTTRRHKTRQLKQLNRYLSLAEIEEALMEFNSKKAMGPDNLHFKLLKKSWQNIKYDLFYVYNTWWFNGILPSTCKRYWIVPVLKPHKNKMHASSYRPVALCPVISRIFEKIMAKRLMNYIIECKFLQNHFGFLKGRGAIDAIANIIDDVAQDIRTKAGKSHGVLLDFSGAFNTVERSLLTNKMSTEYCITGRFINYLNSYLTDRYYSIKIGSYHGDWTRTEYGVPQGSPLSSILFICYVDGIAAVENAGGVGIQFYADDTIIKNKFIANEDHHRLRRRYRMVLRYIQWFCTVHHLSINPTKTQYIIFGKTKAKDRKKYDLKLDLEGHRLEPVDTVKYLGVLIHHNHSITRRLRYLWNISATIVPSILEACVPYQFNDAPHHWRHDISKEQTHE